MLKRYSLLLAASLLAIASAQSQTAPAEAEPEPLLGFEPAAVVKQFAAQIYRAVAVAVPAPGQ